MRKLNLCVNEFKELKLWFVCCYCIYQKFLKYCWMFSIRDWLKIEDIDILELHIKICYQIWTSSCPYSSNLNIIYVWGNYINNYDNPKIILNQKENVLEKKIRDRE